MAQAGLRAIAVISVLAFAGAVGAETGFRPIFDGKTLNGWSAPDMSYWSVRDGAITAESTPEHPCRRNQFLVWRQGELDDFELKLEFRISGGPSANAGIQIRSRIHANGHAEGYQADIDRAGKWLGALYDEHTGRKLLARRGQLVKIATDGKRSVNPGKPLPEDPILAGFKRDGWNEYHIVARGEQMTLHINGRRASVVIDREQGQRDLLGKLALQMHSGPPMKIQYRNIRLKRLPLADSRKKIVMIAGAPSHPPGEHEFNAGVKLLAGCLRSNESVIVANYHDAGWPKDPTAFDNADAVIFYMDGWKRHAVNGHFDFVDSLADRGVGLMFMHYAVHTEPGEQGDFFKKWIGGFYETGYSANPHWRADLKHRRPHPITRGVEDSTITDEWYFNIRFREGLKDVTAIASATPTDAKMTVHRRGGRWWSDHAEKALGKEQALMWSVQRPDGGRGVGFTGGHWHRNWAREHQRRLVLNAILWVAGAEVPSPGVQSSVTEQMMKQNLDTKPQRKRK
ncbi:MAG: DUF1080 domain-containing protein [Phycisphaerae bacterium]|nr:DUF1080 domain-containing protein [Phycisphaerae bacterium]